MKKTYVFDTCVLAHDPLALESYPDAELIICSSVLEELDKLKKILDEAGKNARSFVRWLDEKSEGKDLSGIELENGSVLKIDLNQYDTSAFGTSLYGDHRILACAAAVTKAAKKKSEVILVTDDINMRLKARAHSLSTQKHSATKKSYDEAYSGFITSHDMDLASLLLSEGWANPEDLDMDWNLQEFVTFEDPETSEEVITGRIVSTNKLVPIGHKEAWGMSPRNLQQRALLDVLLSTEVSLVSAAGSAGTGKSVLAIAAGLEQVLEKNKYEKLVIFKPNVDTDAGIGFLPGSLDEKLSGSFTNILDAFELLFGSGGKKSKKERDIKYMDMLNMYKEKGKIEFGCMSFLRGRSINSAYILLDEIQNTAPSLAKTFLTRAGTNSKIVITGDLEQIDMRGNSFDLNGFSYITNAFKDSHLSAHVLLTEGQRSELSAEAVKRLL